MYTVLCLPHRGRDRLSEEKPNPIVRGEVAQEHGDHYYVI